MRRHGVDAAVMFARHHVPGPRDGVDVELVEGVGPVVASRSGPPRTSSACACPTRRRRAAILEAVRIVRRELRARQAVVGFCGGPFTVAGYLVEGKPSRDFPRVKALMYSRAGSLARADGAARGRVRRVRRRAGARRART